MLDAKRRRGLGWRPYVLHNEPNNPWGLHIGLITPPHTHLTNMGLYTHMVPHTSHHVHITHIPHHVQYTHNSAYPRSCWIAKDSTCPSLELFDPDFPTTPTKPKVHIRYPKVNSSWWCAFWWIEFKLSGLKVAHLPYYSLLTFLLSSHFPTPHLGSSSIANYTRLYLATRYSRCLLLDDVILYHI